MLEHDELLPVEEQHPALVQELRSVYQLTPQEQRVLTRVHERLARTSYPLPAHEPIQLSERIFHRELVDDGRIFPPTFRTRKRWSSRLSAVAGIVFLVLLVGSLVLTFSIERHSSVGNTGQHAPSGKIIRLLLVPANANAAITGQQRGVEISDLMQRLDYFASQEPGVQLQAFQSQTIHGQSGFLLEIHFTNVNQSQITKTLLQVGVLDFWNTGLSSNPSAILDQGVTFHPAQYAQYNPGARPPFTNADIDPNSLSRIYDPQTSYPEINIQMKEPVIGRFGTFTAEYVGYGLTITLDGKVISSANIQSAINGPFVIPGNYTEPQIQALIAVLKFGPLPYALKIVS